jgi:hypothetical protein
MFKVVIWLYVCSNNLTLDFFESLEVKRGILLDLSRKIAFLSLNIKKILATKIKQINGTSITAGQRGKNWIR